MEEELSFIPFSSSDLPESSDCSWNPSHLGGGTVPAAQGLRSSPALAHWFFPKAQAVPKVPSPSCAPPAHGMCSLPSLPTPTELPERGRSSRDQSVCRSSAALGQRASGTDSVSIAHTWNYQQVTPQESTTPRAWPCIGLGCSWGLFML